ASLSPQQCCGTRRHYRGRVGNRRPPSARPGLTCQAGLLTWLPSLAAAFPDHLQWLVCGSVHLTALGTFRLFPGFPILRPPGRHLTDTDMADSGTTMQEKA